MFWCVFVACQSKAGRFVNCQTFADGPQWALALVLQEQAKSTLSKSRETWTAQDERLKARIQQLLRENDVLRESVLPRGRV